MPVVIVKHSCGHKKEYPPDFKGGYAFTFLQCPYCQYHDPRNKPSEMPVREDEKALAATRRGARRDSKQKERR